MLYNPQVRYTVPFTSALPNQNIASNFHESMLLFLYGVIFQVTSVKINKMLQKSTLVSLEFFTYFRKFTREIYVGRHSRTGLYNPRVCYCLTLRTLFFSYFADSEQVFV